MCYSVGSQCPCSCYVFCMTKWVNFNFINNNEAAIKMSLRGIIVSILYECWNRFKNFISIDNINQNESSYYHLSLSLSLSVSLSISFCLSLSISVCLSVSLSEKSYEFKEAEIRGLHYYPHSFPRLDYTKHVTVLSSVL